MAGRRGAWAEASRRRLTGQRGAALAEAAILSPVFFLLLFAVVELGLAFHDKLTVANMGRAGARAGSTQGKELLGDYQLVQAVNKAAGSLPRRNIAYIVVYKAAAPTDRVPASCAGGTPQAGPTTFCNVYVPADFSKTSASFGCGTSPPAPDRFWCPTTRKVAATPAFGGPPDYVGVYVKVRHDNVTRIFGSGYNLTDDTVLRIEARRP